MLPNLEHVTFEVIMRRGSTVLQRVACHGESHFTWESAPGDEIVLSPTKFLVGWDLHPSVWTHAVETL